MKIKLSLLITILSFFCTTTSFAHPYDLMREANANCKQFIDASSKSALPLNDPEMPEMIVMNYIICTKPEIMKNLSSAEKSHLEEMAVKVENQKNSLSPEQWVRIKQYDNYYTESFKVLKDAVAPRDLSKLTKEERAELDKHLQSIFWKMTDALKNNDIELALSYFSDYHKDKQRQMFQALPAEALQKSVKNIKELSITWIRGDTVHYEVSNNQNGQNYLFPLDFVQDLDGKWRILDF